MTSKQSFDPFAGIRMGPKKARAKKAQAEATCEKPGCDKPGGCKAAKGRGAEGQYWNFCADHAREYNKNYNYFSGMDADEVAEWAKEAEYGHRPTWKMGGEAKAQNWEREARARARRSETGEDAPQAPAREKRVHKAERKALDTLGLDAGATRDDVTARFKSLMAQYHPDLNGGDTSEQGRLREVIAAYKLLKGEAKD